MVTTYADLIPCEPQHAEEANILLQRLAIVDFVDVGEDCQIGDEEEVVEELGGGCFCVSVVLWVVVESLVVVRGDLMVC